MDGAIEPQFSGANLQNTLIVGTSLQFLFFDAPIETGLGPGALPYFEDFGPFFRLFSDNEATKAGWKIELDNINKLLEM